jgi:hypothetical protein
MPAFEQVDWGRPDFEIIASFHRRGVSAIDIEEREVWHNWLTANHYALVTFDFGDGLYNAVTAMGTYFRWEEQFGYALEPRSRDLEALHDGFEFDVPKGGLVLELLGGEPAWREDARWFLGVLSIASEHSLQHLALGRRFFTIVPVDKTSPILSATIDHTRLGICRAPRVRGRIPGEGS